MKRFFVSMCVIYLVSCQSVGSRFDVNEESVDICSRQYKEAEVQLERKILLDTLANGLVLERLNDSTFLWQGDMLFTSRTIDFLSSSSRSGFRTEAQYYWPYGKVYYKFHDTFTDTLATHLAISFIENYSSIRFIPASQYTTNFIEFVPGSGNSSMVGMSGGRQEITIYNTTSYGIIMHEIMHALGFFHEHARTDRDNYIIVNWSNIKPDKAHNFYKFNVNYTGSNLGSFDFNSIMLYDSMITDPSFVYDTSVPVMTKINGNTFSAQRYYLSNGDLDGIAAIYGPPFHRLESHLDEVIAYELGGSTDKLIVDMTDSIVFYQNRECTIRKALDYPRQIRVQTNHRVFVWNGDNSTYTTYRTIEVPAGVSAIHLDSWRDVEWYEQSNPYQLDMKTNKIVNKLVDDIHYSSPIIPNN